MGTPLPPNQPRATCSLCFGPNPILGAVQPRWVTLSFFDVKPGASWEPRLEPFPAGKFLLDLVENCYYRLILPATLILTLDWTAGHTRVDFITGDYEKLFETPLFNGTCQTTVYNRFTTPAGNYCYGGKCLISWSEKGLT